MNNDPGTLDFSMAPGCVLAQLGGLAGYAAFYSEQYAYLGWKYWPSVLACNIALGCVLSGAQYVK